MECRIYYFRHFKEHLRRQNASKPSAENGDSVDHGSANVNYSNGYSASQVRSSHYNYSSSSVRLQASVVSSTSTSSSSVAESQSSNGRKATFDVKAMQKEAVLSYVKAKQFSPAHSVNSSTDQNEERRSSSPRPTSAMTAMRNAANNRTANGTNSNIPQPATTSGINKYQIGQNRSLIAQPKGQYSTAPPIRKDPYLESSPSTTADAHIAQLKTVLF